MMIHGDSIARFGVVFCTILGLASSFAKADFYSDCAAAIARGDTEKAQEIAAAMMEFRYVENTAQREAGIACLNFARGIDHEYSRMANAFRPAGDDARLREEARAEAAAKREAEEMARQRELAKIAEQRVLEAEQAQRKQRVWSKVAEACRKTYAEDPTAALTNRVCIDLFLQTGLPAE